MKRRVTMGTRCYKGNFDEIYKEKKFHHKGSQILKQVAQKGHGIAILGHTQTQLGIELPSETQVNLKIALFRKGFGLPDLQRSLPLPS